MKYSRDSVGRFSFKSTLKYYVARISIGLKRVMIMMAFFLMGSYGVLGINHFVTHEPSVIFARDSSTEIFKTKIEQLKNEVVSDLMDCESAGHKEADGIIIFDTNKKASIGRAQFQVATVIHYYKILYGKDISRKEAVEIALNDDKAAELAKRIGFETNNKFGKDWVNCTVKYDLDKRADLIKQLEN